ncbi:hypothetical protein GCM10009602_07670 [Nocardiopsis tropica]
MHLLLIDNARLYAEPLARRLRGHVDINEVTLCSLREINDHTHAEALRYDAALINASAPNVEQVISSLSKVPLAVIALGVEETEKQVIGLAESGAAGYVPLSGDIDDVVRSTRAAVRREMHCSPDIAFQLWRHIGLMASQAPEQKPAVHLTRREQEVLSLISLGASNQQISRELFIELRTVKNHVHNILRKLGAKRRGEAAARAHELVGWSAVTPSDAQGRRSRNLGRRGS